MIIGAERQKSKKFSAYRLICVTIKVGSPRHAAMNEWDFIPPQWSSISSRHSEASPTWRSKP